MMLSPESVISTSGRMTRGTSALNAASRCSSSKTGRLAAVQPLSHPGWLFAFNAPAIEQIDGAIELEQHAAKRIQFFGNGGSRRKGSGAMRQCWSANKPPGGSCSRMKRAWSDARDMEMHTIWRTDARLSQPRRRQTDWRTQAAFAAFNSVGKPQHCRGPSHLTVPGLVPTR